MRQLILVLLILLLVTACGPRLEQVVDYIPPVTESGLACIQQAESQRQMCQQDNEQRVNACMEDARQQSYRELAIREEQYTADLETYIDLQDQFEKAKRAYNEQRRLVLRDGELAYIRCSNDVNLTQTANYPQCQRFLDEGRGRADQLLKPQPPLRPVRPQQEQIFRELSRNCSSVRTNCNTGYDQSYISCGGRIERSTVCVANCN